jgi:HD-like signal output (HDOD) protein
VDFSEEKSVSAAEVLKTKKITYDYVLQKLVELPTLPAIVGEITKLINDPMSSTKEIVTVMENDQAITTKVLKLINSAYYAIPGGVKSLERAIALLGFDEVYQLVLSTSVFKSLRTQADPGFDIKKFWQHSIGVAMTAQVVGKHLQHKAPHDLFTAGLVHDMGKVALIKIDAEYVGQISKFARENKLTFDQAEDKLETVKHSIVGHMLAQKWNLPMHLQSAIRYHHILDIEMRKTLSSEMNQFVDIIIFSNLLMHFFAYGDSGYDVKLKSPEGLTARLSIQGDAIKEIALKVHDVLEEAGRFLEIIGAD